MRPLKPQCGSTVKPPDNDSIDGTPLSDAQQDLSLGADLRAGAYFLHFENHLPTAALRVGAHGG